MQIRTATPTSARPTTISHNARTPAAPDEIGRTAPPDSRASASSPSATLDWAVNAQANAASSSAHPAPSTTRAPVPAASMRPKKKSVPIRARHRDAGKQSKPADLAVAGLTVQLQRQHALGALALRRGLFALELESAARRDRSFLQRGDDDAGEPGFECAGNRPRGGVELLLRRVGGHRPDLPAARQIGDADHGIENLQPRHRHLFGSQPAGAERALRRRSIGDDHIDVWIVRQRDGRGLRRRGSIGEGDGDAIAGLVSLQDGGHVGVARHTLPVELLNVIVLVDARGVNRPGRRDEVRNTRAGAAIRASGHRARLGRRGACERRSRRERAVAHSRQRHAPRCSGAKNSRANARSPLTSASVASASSMVYGRST